LDSPEVDERWWAVRTLAQMTEPPADWLIAVLSDPASEVRQCAALALCHHPDGNAIPGLIQLLADPEPVSAELAADALTAIGGDALPALVEALEKGPHKARVEAVRALAAIRDPRVTEVERLQAYQLLQVNKAGIRDPRAIEEENLQARQPLQMHQGRL
jgi:HEAT repeat protein